MADFAIRVFDASDGTEATVNITTAAQTYLNLNAATADQVRMVTVADYTIIVNTTVKLATATSAAFDITTVHSDYDVMTSWNPTPDTYHSTEEDTVGHPLGFWQYTESDNGFAEWAGPEVGSAYSEANGAGAYWDDKSKNPMGFKVTFNDAAGGEGYTASGAGTAAVNQTYTATGTQNGKTAYQGDTATTYWIYWNSTFGSWEISTDKTNQTNPQGPTNYFIYSGADTPPLSGWAVGNQSTVDGTDVPTFVGSTNTHGYEVIENFYEDPETSLEGIALRLQRRLQAAGARNALIHWVATAANKGRFVITSPYRGTGASISDISAPDAVWDLSDNSTTYRPFDFSRGTATAGSGNVTSQVDVLDRWTRVPPPGQASADLDATTMPVKMVRQLAYTGTGAGTAAVNQVYTAAGFVGGKTARQGNTGSTYWIYWNATFRAWEISTDKTNVAAPATNSLYYVFSNADSPPLTGWAEGTGTTVPTFTTGITPLVFDVSAITWGFRPNGDSETSPVPSLWSDGRKISDLAFHRNRMVLAGDESVVFSRSDDFFEFYQEDFDNIVDSDPIDATLSLGSEVNLLDFIVPFRQSLVCFTKAGRQFEFNSPDTLSPSTGAFTPSTSYQTLSVRPQQSGSVIYFAATRQDAAMLQEYYYDDTRVSNFAADVTAHAYNLLPTSLRTIQTSPNNNMVLVLPSTSGVNDNDIYVYTSFWSGQEKVQSAWTTYTFDAAYEITDIAVVDNECFMLVDVGAAGFVIEKFALSRQTTTDSNTAPFAYVVHLDRQFELTGVYSDPTTTWTLPNSFSDTTLDTIVLGPDFTDSGGVKTPTANGTTLTLAGDWSDGEVKVGRAYTMSTELSQQYVRDFNGTAILSGRLQVRRITANYQSSMAFDIRSNMRGRSTDRTKSFSSTTVDEAGVLVAWHGGNSNDLKVFIENTTPKPSTITAIEFLVEHSDRRG